MKNDPEKIEIKDFDYLLPQQRIAEFPLSKRDHSRMLIFKEGNIVDDHFYNLANHLPHGATLVVNDTKVIEARILFKKSTGGVIEIFCLEPFEQQIEESLSQTSRVRWQCLIGGASKWKPGQILNKNIRIADQEILLSARFINRNIDSFVIEFSWDPPQYSFSEVLHAAGAIPLPPYIKREATEDDAERYQTVFGQQYGSVAAPTSALHFTQEVFESLTTKKIEVKKITLHVGAGTFKPVKSETIVEHNMHSEPFSISLQNLKKIMNSEQLIAVGTTSLRTLESLYWIGIKMMNGKMDWNLQQWEAYELADKFPNITASESLDSLVQWMERNHADEIRCTTSLMIIPGYDFHLPKALITNFHQPQSTLLLLISAFIGEHWKQVYQHALDNDYRFLSYGDSSLLWRID